MNPHIPFPRLPLPRMARIRRKLPATQVPDPRLEVRQQLLQLGLRHKLAPGARIAIAVGSRAIGGLLEMLSGIVDAVKEAGGEPFVIPAMGGDGGAIAEGQAEILRLLGVSEESVGAPVRTTMDTTVLGNSRNGAAVHLARNAADADGIIVLVHAPGLLRMLTVGLGNQRGAQESHSHGLADSVRYVPEVVFAKSKILFGVASVENGYGRPAVIEVVPAGYEAFLKADDRLFEVSGPHAPRLPFRKLDLLVVDEIGKSISGAGMDLNVIGYARANGSARKDDPEIARLVVLSLSKASLGNGLGIGLADFTTRRFADACDAGVTGVSLLTSMEPGGATRLGPLPLALESDREAAEVALYSALPQKAPRICRIANTARLDEMWVSEPLLKESEEGAETLERPRDLSYDGAGNLF
jgi:hypothetical protein